MKKYWNAFIMCQSMFCAIPCIWKAWDEKARPQMLLFLPFVGLEIGIIWAALAIILLMLGAPQLLAGAVLCLYPFFVTGFIHLDGFLDVVDAVKSWRDLERRREILKDSRVGAFAVIACIAIMIVQFAASASVVEVFGGLDAGFAAMPGMFGLSRGGIMAVCMALIPVVSRCCSGLAVEALPKMSTSQYAEASAKTGRHITLFVMVLAAVLAASFVLTGRMGFVLVGCMAGYGAALLRAYKSLQGMNGDISGYALTIGEMCGMVMLALMI